MFLLMFHRYKLNIDLSETKFYIFINFHARKDKPYRNGWNNGDGTELEIYHYQISSVYRRAAGAIWTRPPPRPPRLANFMVSMGFSDPKDTGAELVESPYNSAHMCPNSPCYQTWIRHSSEFQKTFNLVKVLVKLKTIPGRALCLSIKLCLIGYI